MAVAVIAKAGTKIFAFVRKKASCMAGSFSILKSQANYPDSRLVADGFLI
jgi:hypothetical protein